MGWQMYVWQMSEKKSWQMSQKYLGRCHKIWGGKCPDGNCLMINIFSEGRFLEESCAVTVITLVIIYVSVYIGIFIFVFVFVYSKYPWGKILRVGFGGVLCSMERRSHSNHPRHRTNTSHGKRVEKKTFSFSVVFSRFLRELPSKVRSGQKWPKSK